MQLRYRLFTLITSIILISSISAQNKEYTAFTVRDGLPSNYVYRALEGNDGYLWVATDAGIARYDGKSFQVFTTDNGLPDNEVLSIAKEINGRIWVNCFKQKPAYFDEIKNRFINAKENPILNQIIEGTSEMNFFPLKNGGMMFSNEKATSIIREENGKQTIELNKSGKSYILEDNQGNQFFHGYEPLTAKSKGNQVKIFVARNGKQIDSSNLLMYHFNEHVTRNVHEGNLYYFMYQRKKMFKISGFQVNPLKFTIDSISIPENYNNYQFTPTSISLLGNSGKIHVFNKQTLQFTTVFSGNYIPNSIYDDKYGNHWVSSIDKGLLLYRNSKIKNIQFPANFTNKYFMSITKASKNTILAGNIYGEIIEVLPNQIKLHKTVNNRQIARIRKIIATKKQVFTFSETGVFKNYQYAIKNDKKTTNQFSKTAIHFNDSIIISGHTSSLSAININDLTVKSLDGLKKRVTALGKDKKNEIYFGSTDGLYKYNYSKNQTIPLNRNNGLLSERITSISFTQDQLGWVSTGGSGIAVIRKDKVIAVINERNGLVSNAVRCLVDAMPGQIWIGTSNGISRLSYTYHNDKLQFKINNITVQDGLANNIINELAYKTDTIYAATSDGISIIPTTIKVPEMDIPVRIQKISINQRDTAIYSIYNLGYQQRNIQLKLAGIDITGRNHHVEYNLDNAKTWRILSQNNLTLELSHGNHQLKFRAVDINGYKSNQISSIIFNINSPVWKSIWFWLVIAIVIQSLFMLFIYKLRIKKRKHKIALEYANLQTAALEQQSFSSLMNPHFIFNALNSIQHYINLQDRKNANRYLSDFASLIRKNFEAVQQYFIVLDQEIENLKIYLRLEKMRFTEKLDFKIEVDEAIDIEHIMIPTMMLQPLLENAILHGIVPSSLPGSILIKFSHSPNYIIIEISDNGIGIKNSQQIKPSELHKSRGTELINKRIAALNHFSDLPITIEQSPITESLSNPGNRTTIKIPIDLHKNWLTKQNKFNQ
ncbi:histidine kinase [Sediminibacterium sp.]|uniref:sensor histidine kinase n=1 Tax=Sediminibacterium sp. TaxID=1917865 RepID=UPI003F71D007